MEGGVEESEGGPVVEWMVVKGCKVWSNVVRFMVCGYFFKSINS